MNDWIFRNRDALTMLGAFCSSMGTPLVALGSGAGAWWAGIFLSALGGALVGTRAVKEPKK